MSIYLLFYLFFFLYASFSLTVMCTRGFSWNSHVYMHIFCKQSCMPWFFPFWGRLSVDGWVWMIVESSWMLLESVYTFVSYQRRFLVWIFENVLVISFSIFCFGISALGFFYLSAFLGCYLIVLAESGSCRVILFLYYLILIQKIQKNCFFCIIMHCCIVAFCMVLALCCLDKY